MEFRTIVKIPSFVFSISHHDRLLMLGSCFSENIGKKLSEYRFNVHLNPFGILYNPLSIKLSLEHILSRKKFSKEDLFFYDGLFRSFSHHSRFSSANEETAVDNMNTHLSDIQIKNINILLITFGTSYVYQLKETNEIVSNCHKLPDKLFDRRRLTIDEIVHEYSDLICRLRNINEQLKIIFSVSPIRHWKDGAHENQLSKSILLLAIDNLQKKHENVHYFPAYEIVLDELRDYRFYSNDMNHISELAIEYIWERFDKVFFSESTGQLIKEWKKINAALKHKPFNPESEEYKLFQEKNRQALHNLLQKYGGKSDL